MADIIIIGGGPAGVSAALTAKNRGKSVFIISNGAEQSNLWKAHEITNYPGCAGMSGADILKSFRGQLDAVKAQYDAASPWPLKYTQANLEYVQALEGWALAADAWDVKAASASEYAYQDQLDLERISAYLNIEQSRFDFFTASDLLRELLFTAKEHASKGKQLLGY